MENSCPSSLGGEPLSMLAKFVWATPKRKEQSGQAQKQPAVMDSAWLISSRECRGGRVMWGNRKQAQPSPSGVTCSGQFSFLGLRFQLWKRGAKGPFTFRTFMTLRGSRIATFLRGWVRKGTTSNHLHLQVASLCWPITRCFPGKFSCEKPGWELPKSRDEGFPTFGFMPRNSTWHVNLCLAKQGDSGVRDFCCCFVCFFKLWSPRSHFERHHLAHGKDWSWALQPVGLWMVPSKDFKRNQNSILRLLGLRDGAKEGWQEISVLVLWVCLRAAGHLLHLQDLVASHLLVEPLPAPVWGKEVR